MPRAPRQPATCTVRQFRARFPGLVRELRSGLAGFVFHMFVVVDAETEVEVLEAAEGIGQAGFQVDARLLEVDDGSALLAMLVLVLVFVLFLVVVFFLLVLAVFIVLVFVVSMGMAVAGDAVLGVEAADGDSDESAVVDPGEAGGTAADLEGAAGQASVDFLLLVFFVLVVVLFVVVLLVLVFLMLVLVVVLFLMLHGAQRRGLCEPGDVVVVRLAGEGIEVPGHVAAAAVHPDRAVLAVAVVGAAQLEGAAEALRHFLRDAFRVDIDHAADGAGAVEQRRRALQDFHALGHEWIDRHRVVAAADGNVKRVDPVLHDAHACGAQAVDDGAPRARAVGTVVYARFIAHGGPDIVHRLAFEFVGIQNLAGLRESFARKRVRRYDDLLDLRGLFVAKRLFGERGHGESGCQGRKKSLRAIHGASPIG